MGKPPTFSGEENIKGFLRDFDEWCQVKELSELEKVVNLKASMREEAKILLQNHQFSSNPTYEEVRQVLLKAYAEASKRHYYSLRDYRRSTQTLEEYNAGYLRLRSKCKEHLSEFQEVDFYINNINPLPLRNALQTNGPTTLHRAMEMAALLEPVFGKNQATVRQPGQQNLDRIKCTHCGKWHHKDAAC